jgi:hypothetical protein
MMAVHQLKTTSLEARGIAHIYNTENQHGLRFPSELKARSSHQFGPFTISRIPFARKLL